jgi:type II secretory pathway pseudopilin PulG
MKSEKGVTLIALVLTLIVLAILVSVIGYSGTKTVNYAKLTAFTTEMRIMQSKVNELYEEYKNGNDDILNNGEELSEDTPNIKVFTALGIEDYSKYRYFDEETIKSLGLEEITDEFFVNIATRDVISCKGIKYEGIRYYRLEDLPDGLYNVEYNNASGSPSFEATVEYSGNNEYKIKIRNIDYSGNIEKWTVAYSEGGSNWTETDSYEFTVTTKTAKDYTIYLYNGNIKSDEKTVKVGLSVGDYINYSPDSGEYELSTLATYSGSSLNTGNDEGKITTSDMGEVEWQVLRMYDDGSMDIISTPTTKSIWLYGTLGYNNGVYLLNDICRTLYSKTVNGNKIEARSINIEDMEYWLTDDITNEDGTITTGGKTAKANYISKAVANFSTGTYITNVDTVNNRLTYSDHTYYPILYKEEKGSGIDTTAVKDEGISGSESYYSNLSDLISSNVKGKSYDLASTSGLTITYTYYNMVINSTNYGEGATVLQGPPKTSHPYFVASRCVGADDRDARYAFFEACGDVLEEALIFRSHDSSSTLCRGLRSVVHLGPNTKITTSETPTDSTTPHKITSYGN